MLCVGVTIFEVAEARAGDKRKREKPGDPGDLEGYKGEVSKETEMLSTNIYMTQSIVLEKTFCSPIMRQTDDALCTWVTRWFSTYSTIRLHATRLK